MKILSARYINFMDFVDKTIQFNESVTWIKGKNARGKTSVAGGLMWLLFDCDYDLNSNPPVRRKVNGIPINDIDVVVEAVIEQDGVENKFKKVQKRKISESEKVVGGKIVTVTETSDTNTYYVNDVKVTLKAFNERLGDIKTLMMCSNINAFLSRKPDEIRKYLFSKIENVSDLDIASRNPNLTELVPLLQGHSVEEIKAMQNTAKNGYKAEKSKIDGMIQEREMMIAKAGEIGLAELELEKNRIQESIESLEKQISDVSEMYKQQDTIREKSMKLQFDMSGLITQANKEIAKKRSEVWNKLNDLENQMKETERELHKNQSDSVRILDDIRIGNEKITEYREQWKKESGIEFDSKSLICQYCGQSLPEDKQEQIKSDFEKNKQTSLDRITELGIEVSKSLEREHEELDNVNAQIEDRMRMIDELKSQIAETTQEFENLPETADVSNNAEINRIKEEIAECEKSLKTDIDVNKQRSEMQTQLSGLRNELIAVEKKIAQADTSEDEERLEELQKELVKLEQSKTNAEKIIDLLTEHEKAKNSELSESINSMFSLVKWKLFEYNKSGNYTSCCIPTIDSMAIINNESNKAKRFIGKLDICNSIQKLEEINVPIFLDDVESLDSESTLKALDIVDCQVILLKVTDDEELKIEG